MHLSPGDRVALLVPGSVAYVALVLALLRRGVLPIPMDPRLTPAERRPLFADLEPHHVVTDPAEVPALLDELGPAPARAARTACEPPTAGFPRETLRRRAVAVPLAPAPRVAMREVDRAEVVARGR